MGVKDPEAVTGATIAKAFNRANTFFEKGLPRFETAAAKKFRSVNKGVFKASFKEAGSQEKDQLFRKLFNMESPEAIQNLQQLVGQKTVLNGLKTTIDQAMEKAGESLLADLPGSKALNNVKKALGIGTKSGELTLKQALKGSNVDVGEIKNLFKLIEANDSVFNPVTSSFLQRRLTLAGPAAFVGAGAAGGYGTAEEKGGIFGTIVAITLLRKGSSYLTNPKNLQTMVRALDDSLAPRVRRNAYVRLLNDAYAGGDPENQKFPTMEELETGVENVVSTTNEAVDSIVNNLSPRAMEKIRSVVQ